MNCQLGIKLEPPKLPHTLLSLKRQPETLAPPILIAAATPSPSPLLHRHFFLAAGFSLVSFTSPSPSSTRVRAVLSSVRRRRPFSPHAVAVPGHHRRCLIAVFPVLAHVFRFFPLKCIFFFLLTPSEVYIET
ncbi:hypothetical protein PIB30_047102 [Stylosanthes scabra]|uniref:Uncharacterized protein n=1 Tax=Stylosanthes scabra TaxID=79078 RepID=A0ABU6ZFD7_9FABA|nr:hypothetical protein [Stylosanthes scabra]